MRKRKAGKTSRQRLKKANPFVKERVKRPYTVGVLLSGAELDALEARVRRSGFVNRAEYIRMMLVHGEVEKVSVRVEVDEGAL